MKVKVCGMRQRENVKDVSAAQPDYLGFIFYPRSKRYVGEPEPSLFREVPPNIRKVAVFVNEQISTIRTLVEKYSIDLVQLHGNESPNDCRKLQSAGLQIIKAFGVDENFDFKAVKPYLPHCNYILLDTKSENHGGTGRKFNWNKISEYPYEIPLFLSGGISVADVSQIRQLSDSRLYAVDINSCFENSPGFKNPDLVHQFIQELKKIFKIPTDELPSK